MSNKSNIKFAPNEGFRDPNTNPVYAIVIRDSVKESQITVGAIATKLPTTPLASRLTLLVFNNGSTTLFLGSSTVTTSTGMPLNPNSSLSFAIESGVDIYGITSSSTDVRLLETS